MGQCRSLNRYRRQLKNGESKEINKRGWSETTQEIAVGKKASKDNPTRPEQVVGERVCEG